tara:strand:- start:3554 stop:3865 length:312 start_codon:yes stop_codon:yes gene_type:complete
MCAVSWRELAACKGMNPERFYRDGFDHPGNTKQRFTDDISVRIHPICANCPVRTPCLNDALDRLEPYGIWGGVSPSGRERILCTRLNKRGTYSATNYPQSRCG